MPHLDEATWRARARAHAERADALTAGHRARRERRESHPVEDFLFTYYPTRPGRLRIWHPGADVVLAGAGERAGWKHYVPDGSRVDAASIRPETVAFVRDLLTATASRPAHLGCFGLHEWAMVYRDRDTRHPVPLRLGPEGTDAVVEDHRLRCTHHDAYRFFTAGAAPRNAGRPTREGQVAVEQPGCLHATMDLYKWATKLGPLVPGELLLDTFELARDVRVLDMRASPYDLTALGHPPVRIETAAGKAEYTRAQQGFAARGAVLRARLLEIVADR
ncbi:3-methyladenine DNA glycosylase [Actinomycetospora sp. TBRC 11914]|uniref:3-methyladenine DNA glycosylase n=1 Tax=Actinomycetospora sp. TBRC 11914 TaxID=2729387 RepID=UPI00145CAB04|nr:3-methyladenine DNA glycosylase [Actinomycetospora sp. TBRC 11914]NMO91213.1 3-methyladenine DNA glycosylase [Actinomycetospora sp. TBRC 11914]